VATTTAAARRVREHTDRHERIIDRARAMAEAEGWDSVTTRRLAEAIEYSQPVLYGHFAGGKAEIMNAVALRGFAELAVLTSAATRRPTERARVKALITSYLKFAAANPAVYEAMFTLPISARFASDESEHELKAAFDSIVSVLLMCAEPPRDVDVSAELLWSSLHGIATLERDHRLRVPAHRRRIEQLVELFVSAP
jgi:AcrR family transcriptional regulator